MVSLILVNGPKQPAVSSLCLLTAAGLIPSGWSSAVPGREMPAESNFFLLKSEQLTQRETLLLTLILHLGTEHEVGVNPRPSASQALHFTSRSIAHSPPDCS